MNQIAWFCVGSAGMLVVVGVLASDHKNDMGTAFRCYGLAAAMLALAMFLSLVGV